MPFVLVPSCYEQIPHALRVAVPEFAQSDEYRLVAQHGSDLPGVVLAAFAGFIGTLSERTPTSAALKAGLDFVDRLCGSGDDRILAAVDDEFFATLVDYPAAIAAMEPMMKLSTKEAYRRWRSTIR